MIQSKIEPLSESNVWLYPTNSRFIFYQSELGFIIMNRRKNGTTSIYWRGGQFVKGTNR